MKKIKKGNGLKHSIEYIKRVALEKYGIDIIDDIYINNETKLSYICKKHKTNGIQSNTWATIISKRHPCIYCSKEQTSKKITHSHEQYISQLKPEILNRYTIISRYVNCKVKLDVKCNKCGGIFYIRPDHLRNGHGCTHCIKSKGESNIECF